MAYTKAKAFETVAHSLREFGYHDATAMMVKDCWEAMEDNKSETEMPHGIVGRFAFSQLQDIQDELRDLP